jgi:hypothetical protein
VPCEQFLQALLVMPVASKESRGFMWYRRVKLGYVSAREQTTMCSAASLSAQAWVGAQVELGLVKSCGLGAYGGVPVASWVFCGQKILGVACGQFLGQ